MAYNHEQRPGDRISKSSVNEQGRELLDIG